MFRELPELYPSVDANKLSDSRHGGLPTRTLFQQNLDIGMQHLDHIGWGYKPRRGVWALTPNGFGALERLGDDCDLYGELARLRQIRRDHGLNSSDELEEHWVRVGKPKSKREAELIRAFERWYGDGLRFELPIRGPSTCMYADVITHQGDLLEVKAASGPVTLDQAMAQALTYVDYAERDLRPFVLLPEKPDDNDLQTCKASGVDVIWQVEDAFFGGLTRR